MNVYILTYKINCKKKKKKEKGETKNMERIKILFFFVTVVSWSADDLMILLINQFLLGVKFETPLRPKIMVLKVE